MRPLCFPCNGRWNCSSLSVVFQLPNWKLQPAMSSRKVRILRFFSNSPSRASRPLSRRVWLRDCRFLRPRSKALRRCADAGLVHVEGSKKRVNRTALMEFLSHGLRYVFPPERGSMVRGIPTAAAAEPLKSRLPEDNEPLQSGRMPKEKCAVFLSSPFIRARLRQLYEI